MYSLFDELEYGSMANNLGLGRVRPPVRTVVACRGVTFLILVGRAVLNQLRAKR
jgi:hypothetical protein